MRKKQHPQKGKGWYDKTMNAILGSNLNDGEMHAPLYTKHGFRPGNFLGPGTHVVDNIKKNKKPINLSDKTSKAHDLRYSFARSPTDVRIADLKMVNKLNELSRNKSDYKFNILMGKLPIQAKMLAEDFGILKPGAFSKMSGFRGSTGDRKIAAANLRDLEQQGFGKGKKKQSNAWMTHVATIKKKHPSKSYKEILQIASKSYKKK